MKKAAVLSILFVVVLLAVAVIAEAQQPKKVPRIGYLSVGLPLEAARIEAIRLGSARAWLHRRTEHRHRVPICGGKARSAPRACGGAGASQG